MRKHFQIWQKKNVKLVRIRIRTIFVIRNNYLKLVGVGGTRLFWGTQILRIKSCLCNNLCKHYLVEKNVCVFIWNLFFYLIGIWNKCLKPLFGKPWFFSKAFEKKPHLCTVHANSYNTMLCSRMVMKLCLETASVGLCGRVV